MKAAFYPFPALALVLALAHAQAPAASERLEAELQGAMEAMQDANFHVSGQFTDLRGQRAEFEATVEVIFAENLARVTMVRPAEAASNVLVLDGDVIHNYLFEQNQIIAFRQERLNVLAPYFQHFNVMMPLELGLDRLFEGWTLSELDPEQIYEPLEPVEGAQVLRLRNQDEDAFILYIDAVVLEQDGEWQPQVLNFVGQDGSSVALLDLVSFQSNTGLDPEALRDLPAEAQRLDQP
jgi:hypothetical protein